jgi:hypothetical protein
VYQVYYRATTSYFMLGLALLGAGEVIRQKLSERFSWLRPNMTWQEDASTLLVPVWSGERVADVLYIQYYV